MTGYYARRLSAERLRRCYEIAPPRIRKFLQAEIEFVVSRLSPGDAVLDLGCGYGRALPRLSQRTETLVGIDNSAESLQLALSLMRSVSGCALLQMDAARLAFRDGAFDCVVCIQNGISAFKVDQRSLVAEALRVTREGGRTLFSTYTEEFWPERLDWFRLQAEHGLIGEIDESATGNGIIACKDGFRATTADRARFSSLVEGTGVQPRFTEVDGSSLFCELRPTGQS